MSEEERKKEVRRDKGKGRKEDKSTSAKEHESIRAQVGEGERKEIHIVSRTISITALIIGIAAFLNGLLCIPFALWCTFYTEAGHDFDFIGKFLCVVSIFPFLIFYPLVAIGLVLSTLTLFIERQKLRRFLPLTFVLAVISLFAMLGILGKLLRV